MSLKKAQEEFHIKRIMELIREVGKLKRELAMWKQQTRYIAGKDNYHEIIESVKEETK